MTAAALCDARDAQQEGESECVVGQGILCGISSRKHRSGCMGSFRLGVETSKNASSAVEPLRFRPLCVRDAPKSPCGATLPILSGGQTLLIRRARALQLQGISLNVQGAPLSNVTTCTWDKGGISLSQVLVIGYSAFSVSYPA